MGLSVLVDGDLIAFVSVEEVAGAGCLAFTGVSCKDAGGADSSTCLEGES